MTDTNERADLDALEKTATSQMEIGWSNYNPADVLRLVAELRALRQPGAWSADAPTGPGWYWFLEYIDSVPDGPFVVYVKGQEVFFAAEDCHMLLSSMRGLWQPCAVPSLPDGSR